MRQTINMIVVLLFVSALNISSNAEILDTSVDENQGLEILLKTAKNFKDSNLDSCIFYGLKSLEIAKEENLADELTIVSALISECYEEQNEFEKAVKVLQEGISYNESNDNDSNQVKLLINLGDIFNKTGEYTAALLNYNKAFATAEIVGNKRGMAGALNNMASVYLSQGNYEATLQSVNRAFDIARSIEAKYLILESYKILSEFYEARNNYGKALEYYKLYKGMDDSLYAEENRKSLNEAGVKYETAKKEKGIQESLIAEQKRIIIFIIIITALVSIFAIINFVLYRQKKKTSEFLENVINSLTHPFIVYNVFSGTNEIINKAAKESYSPYYKFLSNENKKFSPYTKETIIAKRIPYSVEYEEVIEGERKFFECYGFPVFNGKMNVSKIIEYAVDITEKREAVDRIKSAFEREKELNELKSNFISSTSHEFRTPLATLFSSVELIQHYDKTKSDDKKDYHLGRIKDIVVYMTKMLDNILTINKADVDKIEFEPEIINIKSFCREILEDIIISASDKHLFDQVFEGNGESVFVDPNLLRHILTNLLSNSIKYSPNGGKILFKTEVLENTIRFTIRDEGIGIPKEDIKNLFQYFFRARNSKTISGTGLGLSIVKKSVEVHKGTIELKSSEGEGTTFVVTLPTNKSLVRATNLNKNRILNANEKNSSN